MKIIICPQCKSESDGGTITCNNCGAQLIANRNISSKSDLQRRTMVKRKSVNKGKSTSNGLNEFFDPSSTVWLRVLLVIWILTEISGVLVVLYMWFNDNGFGILESIGGILSILVLHLIVMLSLNLYFNVQSIKEDMSDIKKLMKHFANKDKF